MFLKVFLFTFAHSNKSEATILCSAVNSCEMNIPLYIFSSNS
jgi:hypothetical protein